jgi:peroxiredoxin Q/BCP
MMPSVGDKAPDFREKDQDGNWVSLSDFEGQKLVLYFYPKDATPTCTTQACNIRDNYEALLNGGYSILGISVDDEKSHQKFIAKHQLPFSLLADTEQRMVNAYGVWGEKQMYGRTYMGTNRTTFVIDEEGIVREVITKVKSKEHASQIIGGAAAN